MKNSNNNANLLTKLTDEERQIVRQILLDVSNQGKSEKLTELYYEDYEEIPVDLETFLCDEKYLGNYTNKGKDIYIIVSANVYEMCRGEKCFDTYLGKYVDIKSYDEYREFILKSRERKEKREEKYYKK